MLDFAILEFIMFDGQFVFSQLTSFLPLKSFRKIVNHYHGDRYIKRFTCMDQYLAMTFAQLTYRESLRDIEVSLRAKQNNLYHIGIRSSISRNTLAKANEQRNWIIYADFAQKLITITRPLYANEDLGLELDNTVYALDASTIDLCLSVFPWAKFRSTKSAVKLHTLLDLQGNIPTFIHISDGKMADVNILDILIPEAGAFYIMDRGYLDFSRLFGIEQAKAFFVIRAKKNTLCTRQHSHKVDKSQGFRCDQSVLFTREKARKDYPQILRRIKYYDSKTGKTFNFLTNNFTIPAQTVAELYRYRWQVELFFKWIKQHLKIKAFFGTSENAVKTQIWIAISVYLLVAIVKKKLYINQNLYTILQILSLSLFDKTPLDQLLMKADYKNIIDNDSQLSNQLSLLDF